MKLYVSCKCGRNKLLIRQYAALGYEVIIVNQQPDRRAEARAYQVKLPFIVNGKVTKL